MTIKVMFVCLGNICRSPTAHGVFEKVVSDASLDDKIMVASSGTGDWHIGASPDARAKSAAKQRGYDLSLLRAQQVKPADFKTYDYILAMDQQNLNDLYGMCPADFSGVLRLFLTYSTEPHHREYREVPDPYYGGSDGFNLVLDLVEDAAHGLLENIKMQHLS